MLRPAALPRSVLALVLGLGLLAGSIESHTEHALSHAPALTSESVAACHPKQALHIEAPEIVTVPACLACWLHLEHLASAASLGRAHVAPAEPGSPASPSTRSPAPAWRLSGPSRAPPSA